MNCSSLLNCGHCDSENICAVCKTGFTLDKMNGFGCFLCTIPNCKLCDTENVCAVCRNGFTSDLTWACAANPANPISNFKTEYILVIVDAIVGTVLFVLLGMVIYKRCSV